MTQEIEDVTQALLPATEIISSTIILNETAVRIATKLIKLSEGCELRAYPDPASELSEVLSAHNKLALYKAGKFTIPEEWERLSGAPWTCGWGETQGVIESTVWTQQEADNRLDKRVREFMAAAIKATSNLTKYSPEKQAAVTSLVYNIGSDNYKKYAISKLVQTGNHVAVYGKFKQYIMANGKVNQGLVNRRTREADLYASVRN